MNVIEVNTQKDLKNLMGTGNKMTTKIVSYEDYVSIEDLLVIKAQLKDLKCKMNNENFYIFTGKVFNDYVFKKAPDKKKESLYKDTNWFVAIKMEDLNYPEKKWEELLTAGFKWIDDVIVNIYDHAGMLDLFLTKAQRKALEQEAKEIEEL